MTGFKVKRQTQFSGPTNTDKNAATDTKTDDNMGAYKYQQCDKQTQLITIHKNQFSDTLENCYQHNSVETKY